ncbi:hypothetical protein KVR01_007174 [Diaporthe batatas]|uniref:uncharacterized protein n=1 Tax=Diaporthe batatas TaxID=748121 RepID=UPI001D05A5F4|nr:uncharacterized protein KVR01_007174 [Diaporthe batatas]KAG8162696.1 hypothetical protein KVR01_007174 [Diaporthe batatas]
MADKNEEWKKQEREIIDKFFTEKVPNALDPPTALCTEESCINFAKTTLQTDDIIPVDNQGSNSFTLISRSLKTVIQFRLTAFRTDALRLVNEIYGDLVPEVKFHEGFPLPVYTSRVIPGRFHVLQPFPEAQFPLARERTTVAELGAFVAKAAFFVQPNHIPTPAGHILQPSVHLLEKLPAVLTHHNFSQVNILVDDSGHLTGVIDLDEAGIEVFGMCIWGLYECFFGMMENGKWSFYDTVLDGGPREANTIRQGLENTFWESLWANTPAGLKQTETEQAVMVSLSVGVINRYFIQGMVDEVDPSKSVHRMSLVYAKGILPQVWKAQSGGPIVEEDTK